MSDMSLPTFLPGVQDEKHFHQRLIWRLQSGKFHMLSRDFPREQKCHNFLINSIEVLLMIISVKALGFYFTGGMTPSKQLRFMSRWGSESEEGCNVFYHWHCFQQYLNTLLSPLLPRSNLCLLSSNTVQCFKAVHQFRKGITSSFLNV